MSRSIPPYRSFFEWPNEDLEMPSQANSGVTSSEVPVAAPKNSSSKVEPQAEDSEPIPTSSSATTAPEETSSLSHHISPPPQRANPVVRIQNTHATTQANLTIPPRESTSPEDFQFAMDDINGDIFVEDPNLPTHRAAFTTPVLLRRSQPTAYRAMNVPPPPPFLYQPTMPARVASSSRAPMPYYGGWRSGGDAAVGGGMVGEALGGENGGGLGSMLSVGERGGNMVSLTRAEGGLLGEVTYWMDGPSTGTKRTPPSNSSSDISPHTIGPNSRHPPVDPQDEPNLSHEGEEDELLLPQDPSLGRGPRRAAMSAPSGFNLAVTVLVEIAQANSRQEETIAEEVPSVAAPFLTLQVNTTPAEDTNGDEIPDEITSAGPSSIAQLPTAPTEQEAGSQLPGIVSTASPSTNSSSTAPVQATQLEPESQLSQTFSASARSPGGDSWQTIGEPTISHLSQAQTRAENSSATEPTLLPTEAQSTENNSTPATPTSQFRSRTQAHPQTYNPSSPNSTASSSDLNSRTALLHSQAFGYGPTSPSPTRGSNQGHGVPARLGNFEVPICVGVLWAFILVLIVLVVIWGFGVLGRQLLEGGRGKDRSGF